VEAYRTGCRFDGWRDQLDFDRWERALAKYRLNLPDLLSGFPAADPVPWNTFVPRVNERFLGREREKALTGADGPQFGNGGCCGCDPGETKNGRPEAVREDSGKGEPAGDRSGNTVCVGEDPGKKVSAEPHATQVESGAGPRYRFEYEKTGRQRFLSHIEMINLIQRALRCSGLPLSFTEGFNPHPRLSLGPALAVGMEGSKEFFDVELTGESKIDAKRFDSLFPRGIRILRVAGPFTRKAGKLPSRLKLGYEFSFEPLLRIFETGRSGGEQLSGEKGLWYHLGIELGLIDGEPAVPPGLAGDPVGYCCKKWEEIFRTGALIRDRKGRERSSEGYTLEKGGNKETLRLIIHAGNDGFAGPRDLLAAVLPERAIALVGIKRLEILYETEAGFEGPLDLVS
jgi:hypothetical protein